MIDAAKLNDLEKLESPELSSKSESKKKKKDKDKDTQQNGSGDSMDMAHSSDALVDDFLSPTAQPDDEFYTYDKQSGMIDVEKRYAYDQDGNKISRSDFGDGSAITSYREEADGTKVEQLRGAYEQKILSSYGYTSEGDPRFKRSTVKYTDRDFAVSEGYRLNEHKDIESLKCESISVPSSAQKYKGKAARVKPEGYTTESKEFPELSQVADFSGGKTVGSISTAKSEPKLVPHSLYIDDKPSQDDVRQAYIGDCYFLAALLQLIHYDPEYIKNMVTVDDSGQVISRFFHREVDDKGKAVWKRTEVVVNYARQRITYENNPQSEDKGAFFRISYNPKLYKWTANFNGSNLKVSRDDYYEAAMWVNLLEQSYSIFAQKYGRYGVGKDELNPTAETIPSAVSDKAEAICGGRQSKCLGMLYGDRFAGLQSSSVSLELTQGLSSNYNFEDHTGTSVDDIYLNNPVVSMLLELAKAQSGHSKYDIHIGFGSTGLASESGGFVQMDSRSVDILKRFVIEIERLPESERSNHPQWSSLVSTSNNLIAELQKESKKRSNDVIKECVAILTKKDDELSNAVPLYNGLKANLGTAFGSFFKTGHAFNVDHVEFKNKSGEDLEITEQTTLESLRSAIDLDQSLVVVQNPWGHTAAGDRTRDDVGIDTGSSHITIREALSAITLVDFGRVINDRPADADDAQLALH